MAPEPPDSDGIDYDQLADNVVRELDPGTVVDDKLVLSRRQVIALAGSGLGTGALALWASGGAAAADGTTDESVGAVGAQGDSVDVYLDQLLDDSGDEVLNVDDSGTANATARGWEFDSISAASVANGGSPFEATDGLGLPDTKRIRNESENSNEQFIEIQNENLADGGKAQIIPNEDKDSTLGTAIINCDTGQASGIVAFGGGADAAYILADPNNSFTTTEGNDGTVNVYYDAGDTQYQVNNELGFQQDIRIYYFN